ncbi:hypothetical protein K438DRAFT_1778353 [Mycena galopus ATCC 62051]|nr:hypothetical protein K438DRAFT_1778353 [Mycena galopus ATCC 62051]
MYKLSSVSPQPLPLDFVDIGPQLLHLAKFVNGPGDTPMLTPLSVQQSLNSALEYLKSQSGSQTRATIPEIPDTSEPSVIIKQSTNVVINRVTTLQILQVSCWIHAGISGNLFGRVVPSARVTLSICEYSTASQFYFRVEIHIPSLTAKLQHTRIISYTRPQNLIRKLRVHQGYTASISPAP